MPTFRATPSASLTGSIRKLLASNGGAISPLQEIQVDQAAADTAHKMGLAEKARFEVESMQREDAARADPAARTAFAAHSAGIDLPEGNRLMNAIRGTLEQPGVGDIDDAMVVGREAQPYVTGKPNIAPGQERVFRSALAAAAASQLGTGKTNADQLTQATGNVQGQGITEAVQAAIAAGNVDQASALNQGGKLGQQVKVFDNVGNTGATFAPGSGTVNADPTKQPGNALLRSTLDQGAAQAERDRAAAVASRAATGKKDEPKDRFKDVTTLRKEFNDQKEVQAFRDIIPIVEAARTTPDTLAGDIQIAYAVGKILDPASVVREGELKLVGNAATVLEKFKGEFAALTQGKGRLTPATRASLMGMLDTAVTQRETAYKATEDTYRGIAAQNGFPMDQVIINAPRRAQPGQPAGEVQARKKVGNVEFVKINGKWFQP